MYLLPLLPALTWALSVHKTTLQDRLDEVSDAMASLKKESASLPRTIADSRSTKPLTHTNLQPSHDIGTFISTDPSSADQAYQAITIAKQNLSSVQSLAASSYSLSDIATQVEKLSQQVSQMSEALTEVGVFGPSTSSTPDSTLVTAIAAGADATSQQKVDINILKANLARLNSTLATMMVTLDGEISDTQDTLSSSMNMRFQALSNQLDQVTATVAGTSPTSSPTEAEITALSDRVSALEASSMNGGDVAATIMSTAGSEETDGESGGLLGNPMIKYGVYAAALLLALGSLYWFFVLNSKAKVTPEGEPKEEASPTAGTVQSEGEPVEEESPAAPRQDLVEEEIA